LSISFRDDVRGESLCKEARYVVPISANNASARSIQLVLDASNGRFKKFNCEDYCTWALHMLRLTDLKIICLSDNGSKPSSFDLCFGRDSNVRYDFY